MSTTSLMRTLMRMLPLALLPLLVAGKAAAPPPVEGPADDTVREAIKTLEASSVERVPLDRYALFGLDALADFDRCLGRRGDGASLVLSCGGVTLNVAWPPKTSDDVATLLSNAMRLVDPQREVRPDRTKLVVRALARAVDDPYTAYLPPEMVAVVTASKPAMFSATPGVEVWPRDPQKIRDLRRGSDAAKSSLQPGDRIMAIDNTATAGMTLPEIMAKLFGANDSVVQLKVKSTSGERNVTLSRSVVPESDVIIRELDDDVFYVHVPVFKNGVAKRVASTLWEARPRGVILDLRHNGGGLVTEGVALADLFLGDGLITAVRGKSGAPTESRAHKDGGDIQAPLVVLVDGGSASASELLTMALKERGRAKILGTQTAGKGSVQVQIQLPDGGVLKVTTAHYIGPNGHRLPEHGITPDRFLAAPAGSTVLEGGDPRKDSWVLSALDEIQGIPKSNIMQIGQGPEP
jgi:carboxyl-terminal processing protease